MPGILTASARSLSLTSDVAGTPVPPDLRLMVPCGVWGPRSAEGARLAAVSVGWEHVWTQHPEESPGFPVVISQHYLQGGVYLPWSGAQTAPSPLHICTLPCVSRISLAFVSHFATNVELMCLHTHSSVVY